MFSLLTPMLRNLASGGMQSGLKVAKDHIILWGLVLVASLFLLLFGNLTIYLLLAAKIGAIYAGVILCLLWAAALVAALSTASSLYKKAKNAKVDNSVNIVATIHRNRELLMPIALSILPLLRSKKRIAAIFGAVVGGGITAIATRLSKRKR